MRRRTLLPALAVSIGLGMLLCCKSATRESRDGYTAVTIDLNTIAPIGYEICGGKPPKLSHENFDLRITMPARFEIPPEQENYGAKYVEFKPGQHEVDVYKNRHSARLLWTRGSLEMEDRVPTIHVKLPLAKLSKGRYVLGISGDPYFAYCTVDLQ